MMDTGPWLLGLLAGATIFLGLPVARLRKVATPTKALLNATATGVLIFLLIEICGHVLEEIEELIVRAATGQPGLQEALQIGGLFVLGFSLGLLGLVYFEQRHLGRAKDLKPGSGGTRLATMIAVGLGLHNLSEGLAIGQGYASGAFGLAWLLAIGFALHNATEGFGIAAPLSGEPVSWPFLIRLGVIAGGPTFVGAVIGGWWVNKPFETFCLALASGTILYIIGELLHLGRQLRNETVVAAGLLLGFFLAMGTDFVLASALQQGGASAPATIDASGQGPIGEQYHRPLHGGYFGDANVVYHYEVLLTDQPRRLRLYVNDSFNRPIRVTGLENRWTVNPDSPKPIKGTFTPGPEEAYFETELPPLDSEFLHVEVAVRKGRIWAPLEFSIPAPSR